MTARRVEFERIRVTSRKAFRDCVHLSYDRMESLLRPYANPQASAVARDLDSKIVAVLEQAAR